CGNRPDVGTLGPISWFYSLGPRPLNGKQTIPMHAEKLSDNVWITRRSRRVLCVVFENDVWPKFCNGLRPALKNGPLKSFDIDLDEIQAFELRCGDNRIDPAHFHGNDAALALRTIC